MECVDTPPPKWTMGYVEAFPCPPQNNLAMGPKEYLMQPILYMFLIFHETKILSSYLTVLIMFLFSNEQRKCNCGTFIE